MSGTHGWAPSPARPRIRRILRLLGWNALVLFVLLALAAGGMEVYLRLTAPPNLAATILPARLVPGVGIIHPPHTETLYTNKRDFWQTSRTNSLGFLDREPPDPERAAASCHVTLFGDSFVDAREVPIADKAQVRLEELAAREALGMDVTTSAFGFRGTGQINQLAFYDAFARRLSPDVVVLVTVRNDLWNNSLPMRAWFTGFHPDHPPHLFARRGADGEMEFVPPASSLDALRANLLRRLLAEPQRSSHRQPNWLRRVTDLEAALLSRSHLADWLWRKLNGGTDPEWGQVFLQRAEWLSRQPRYATFADGWDASRFQEQLLHAENPPPAYREALDVTRFALEQFRERTERDGATLVVLAVHEWGGRGSGWFDLLHTLAGNGNGDGEGIPVISQHDHIIAAGGEVGDGIWANDPHWNATGHQWAAEAIWEWLKANPGVCD